MAAGRARGSRPRRVSLPGVAELLRPVGPGLANDFGRQASGREAHPQKITVYLSSDEFLDLERVRLTLRAHGIGVDRGRLVREAIALLMTDLEAGIDASVIANRLRAAGTPDPADDAPAAVGAANGAPVANGAAVANGAPVNGALADGARVNRDLADVVRVDDVLADVAGVNRDSTDVVRVDGGLTDVAAVADGVLVGAGPANGTAVDGGAGHGSLADGGSINGGLAGGGPVVGVLANGVGVTGPPEGPQ